MLSFAPARKLTSREVARIVSAFLGALIPLCENGGSDIVDVLQHFEECKKEYKIFFMTTDKTTKDFNE